MMTLHFTNKKTNEVYGYESKEEAKELYENYADLHLMTPLRFEQYKNPPIGGRWTYKGWVIDPDLLAEAEAQEEAQAEAKKQAQISELKLRLQVHLLMGEEEEAKALVLEIRALQK